MSKSTTEVSNYKITNRIVRWVLTRSALEAFLLISIPFITANSISENDYILKISASIFSIFLYFSWYLMIGINLNNSLPPEQFKSDLIFKLSWFYVLALLSSSFIIADPDRVDSDVPIYIFILLGFFVFSFFYIIYFTANSFAVTFEHKDKYFPRPEIILLAFLIFPIGIWIIQPRIKKMFKNTSK